MIKKPLVLTQGNLEQLQSGDQLASIPNILELTNGETSTAMLPGNPVYVSTSVPNAVKIASASVSSKKNVVAFSIAGVAPGAISLFQVDGTLELSTAEWDAVTGETGGLTAGGVYFLDNTAAGELTQIVPLAVGHFVVRLGIAINATKLELKIGTPIKL